MRRHIAFTILLTLMTLLSGFGLVCAGVNADDSTVSTVTVSIDVACSLSATEDTPHSSPIPDGIYTPNIGATTIKTVCNDNEGFAIYAAGYTGDEIGGTNSNKLVGTSASNNAVIDSGIATTSGSSDVSNWAMKLTITQDSGDTTGTNAFTIDSAPNVDLPSQAEQGATSASFSNYHTVPNEYVKVAHKNSVTDMNTTTGGVKLTTTYAAYISKTQPADTYSGQVIYTLVHPASHVAPGLPIPPSSCPTPVPGLTYMQDITSSNKSTILSNMTEDSQYYLADKRDDKTYCVAKLKDGNLWMTQNLDHDIVTDGSVTYDNTTTDLGWNGTSYSTASWTPSTATYSTAETTWNDSTTTPESYDPGELYWNGMTIGYSPSASECTAVGGVWDSTLDICNQISSTGNSHYHLGNYYNWTAAIASNDTSMYGVYNETTGQYDNLETHQSICPTGWTLPYAYYNYNTYRSGGDFTNLWIEYGWDNDNRIFVDGVSTVWSAPLYFAPTGAFYGYLVGIGWDGTFQSSVASDDERTYSGSFDGDSGFPAVEDFRDSGNPVRCLLR